MTKIGHWSDLFNTAIIPKIFKYWKLIRFYMIIKKIKAYNKYDNRKKLYFNRANLQTSNKSHIKIIDFRRFYEKNFLIKSISKKMNYFIIQQINKSLINLQKSSLKFSNEE
jgi:hypothetical protein